MGKHYYNLSYVLYSPAESTEPDKYMVEVPELPGCRAWGDTPEEAIEILASLAPTFVQLYSEEGDAGLVEVFQQGADSPPVRGSMMVSV